MLVEITKLRINYEVRFPYDTPFQNYLKKLPKDQLATKMDLVKQEDGSDKEDWYRVVNDAGLSKVIDYIKTNDLKFRFTNLEKEEIEKIKNDYLERKKRSEDSITNRSKDLDVSGIDFSFMKIQPFIYQKQDVVFFEGTGGKAILGSQPGV